MNKIITSDYDWPTVVEDLKSKVGGRLTHNNILDWFGEQFGGRLLTVEGGSYSGSMWSVFGSDWSGPVAYLKLAYGSCSYCDDLEGCHDETDELAELIAGYADNLVYAENGAALFNKLIGNCMDYSWYCSDFTNEFIPEVARHSKVHNWVDQIVDARMEFIRSGSTDE